MELKRAVVTILFVCNLYVKPLCSRNFSPPKLLSDDRAPTIRPHVLVDCGQPATPPRPHR